MHAGLSRGYHVALVFYGTTAQQGLPMDGTGRERECGRERQNLSPKRSQLQTQLRKAKVITLSFYKEEYSVLGSSVKNVLGYFLQEVARLLFININ